MIVPRVESWLSPAGLVMPWQASESDDELGHVVCHDENWALCGTNVSGAGWKDNGDPPSCVVCAELEGLDCPVCDAPPVPS